MTHRIRYIMVGGFLGAGKTTTLSRLAAHYMSQAKRVGIVTNDQADDLVDTNTLRAQGFDVGEVAGACFCCNFNELIDTMAELGEEGRPDVILAEPVGSCTDLVATVIQPIKQLYDADFSIAPYCVLLKPSHGRRVLRNERRSGFSPKAAYILRKQIEEADAVLINRIDELSAEQVDELTGLVTDQTSVPVLRISARTGDGFEKLIEFLDQDGDFGRRILDIDYDIYADGEAELGWVNSSARVEAPDQFSLDDFLVEIVERLRCSLLELGAEPAHLKAIGLWEGFFGVANLISSENAAELSLSSGCDVRDVDLIVNARVVCDPAELEARVIAAVTEACQGRSAEAAFRATQSFRPGRPVPTHRVAQDDV